MVQITSEQKYLQARMEPSQHKDYFHHIYKLVDSSKVLAHGHAIGSKIGCGKVRVISSINELHELRDGEILVASEIMPDWGASPDWKASIAKVKAIVTDRGGRTGHSAITAIELGIPAIVACSTATRDLHTGQEVTVSCAEGENGKIYEGLLEFKVEEIPVDNLPNTRTQILINIGNPEKALSLAALPCDGVGVARTEFIIANEVQVHPLALVHFDNLKDLTAKQKIAELTIGYDRKSDYFVDKMVEGISQIATAFRGKPVVVRMSDFKSNEYANLIGGREFEPKEENPMIGWRGASRYYDPLYREAYHLECQAIKRVRDEMGLTNVIPLIPFCRTPDEGRQVLAEMETQGLKQGENGLQIYVMCETPLNVLLADEFCEIIDGFSIGSNDLTQLIMGIDRDSERIDHLFDERNKGVKQMIASVVKTAKQHNRKIGICGQAPSDYPELIPFLIELGIDSISVSPDSLINTRLKVSEAELSFGIQAL
jgi:pyruvate, water dikinase